jgi:2-keto-3-deoxy-L-rhamnonate aldolase RhmA
VGRLPRRLSAGLDLERPTLCLCLTQARTPDIVLVARAAGFDAVYVDLEHGVTPLDVTSMLCTTALGVGLIPFVRVPSADPATITQVLDGGALGVIVPHVDSAEQVEAVVDACRFPPVGRRALYGATPVTGYASLPADELRAALDADVVVTPMIESAAAVENVEKIVATDGVDVVLVGVHDLSADLGVAGQLTHDSVRAALLEVADACAAHGRCFGVAGLDDPMLLSELTAHGLGFVSAGTDVGLLQRAATERVDALRELLVPGKDGTR